MFDAEKYFRQGICLFTKNSLLVPFILFICGCLTAGCREPVKEYNFVNLNPLAGWEADMPVNLQVDMKDTVGESTLYFSLRLLENETLNGITEYPVTLLFTSPEGAVYTDTLSLPAFTGPETGKYKSRNGMREIEWPYRKGIRNQKGGTWQITVRQNDKHTNYKNITGLGIHCRQDL